MKNLLKLWMNREKRNRRKTTGGSVWMQSQLTRMAKMNQGVISMSGGK